MREADHTDTAQEWPIRRKVVLLVVVPMAATLLGLAVAAASGVFAAALLARVVYDSPDADIASVFTIFTIGGLGTSILILHVSLAGRVARWLRIKDGRVVSATHIAATWVPISGVAALFAYGTAAEPRPASAVVAAAVTAVLLWGYALQPERHQPDGAQE